MLKFDRMALFHRRSISFALALTGALWGSRTRAWAEDPLTNDIASLKKVPFEELLNIEVSTVSKQPERLLAAPSAVQVITAEEIRRSGASTLPEALRLASNLQVAQIDSRQWAISARGFNASTANKLLVMIDGRTVYTPLFAGVFWDVQNVLLEDIDRIEVVSGPGASLWGANAVNGVINVIRKSARDTQGTMVSGGGGSILNGFGSARYGGKIGSDLYFRIYGLGFDRDSTVLLDGRDATNSWFMSQGGFRADWLPPQGETLTVQGDFYGGAVAQSAPGDITVDGQNLLARWTHPLSSESELTFQAYWDRTWRHIPGIFSEELNTYDLDLQHHFHLGERNRVVWGGGYRLMADDVGNSPVLAFLPDRRNLQLFSGFVQDEIVLIENQLSLTVGSKFEHNDYSRFEIQPSARLSWQPVEKHTFWGAISRAVRSPSRIDTEYFVPGVTPYFVRGGGSQFDSEKLLAYELGYRTEINSKVALSVSGFFNDYDKIRSVEPISGAPGQYIILNGLRAETYGAELSINWQAAEWWRVRGGYTWFQKHVYLDRSNDFNSGTGEGNDPHHQFVLQSMINLPANLEFDSVLRYVDNLNQIGPTVPAYLELDLRLAWQPTPNWEVSLVGQNLLDNQHPEFGAPATRQEIPRSFYGKVTWSF